MESRETRSDYAGGELFALPSLQAAAHELKSPLALVRQLSLALEAGDLNNNEVADYLRRIRLTSERSLALVDDLTLASKLDENTLFELEPLNPLAVCEAIVDEMSPLYSARERKLILRPKTRQSLVIANKRLLVGILRQFIDNALHYADANSRVELTTMSARDQKTVRIGVRDYGPAVASDIWRRASGEGTQPVARRPGSSGLGLYIAKQFADNMGANLGVVRHRDGATFYVTLRTSTQISLV